MFYDVQNAYYTDIQKFLAELLATTILIIVAGGSGAVQSLLSTPNLLVLAIAQGFTISLLTFTFYEKSGAHFNTAYTVIMWWFRKITTWEMVYYAIAQFSGALLGGVINFTVYGTSSHLGTPIVGPLVTKYNALAFEIIGTVIQFTVVFTFTRYPINAICAGLSYVALVLVGGPVSAASLNPVRHFGPAVVSGSFSSSNGWIYYAGPFIAVPIVILILYILTPFNGKGGYAFYQSPFGTTHLKNNDNTPNHQQTQNFVYVNTLNNL